jgi:Lrp/AsnC family transcriptional regulator
VRKPIVELDSADRTILQTLQRDATTSTAALAEMLGMSQPPCWRRIQRLRTEGVIRAEVALLDRRTLGLNAHIFALVKLNAHGRANLTAFAETIRSFPEVLDCFVLMGAMDFMLRIVAPDIEAYESFFFDRLSQVPGVQEINSMVALSEIKSTTALPLLGGEA